VLPHPLPVGVHDRPGFRRPVGPGSKGATDVAIGDEADALALGLVGGREAEVPGDRADLRFRELPEREPRLGQLVLAEAVQEVGLVLVVVVGAEEVRLAVGPLAAAGVVAGGDGVAVVELAGAPEQRAELDGRVAVGARRRRSALEVGGSRTPLSNSRSRFMT
jgi:hypothetical protein